MLFAVLRVAAVRDRARRRSAATSSTPTSRRSRPGTRSAPTRSATTSGRGCSTAGATRWRSRSPSTSSGSCVGGLLGALAAYLGLVRRHRDHARPRRADRLPVAGAGARDRPEPRRRASCTRSTRCAFFSVPAFARLARAGDPAPARAAVHARRAAGGHARAADPAAPRRAEHRARSSSPSACSGWASTIILEGALSFLGLGVPPPAAELGEHDLRGAGSPVGRAEARAAARAPSCSSRCWPSTSSATPCARAGTRRDERRRPGRRRRRGRQRPGDGTAARGARPARALRPRRSPHLRGQRPQLRADGRAHAGAHRRVGLGQDRRARGRSWGCCPRRATVSGSVRFDGAGAARAVRQGDAPPPRGRHRDGLPGPVALAEPDHAHRRPDRRGGPRPRARRPRRPRATGRSSCSSSCGCPRRSSACTSTPTSSRAACASAW